MTSRKHLFFVSILLLVSLLFVSLQSANAGISQHLAYQGVLTDTAGNPRPDGLYLFIFQLYDVEAGGAALWSEEKSLNVNKGIFSTFLGNVTPFGSAVMFNKPYWLGITVGSAAELTPRIPLGSAAYCLRSQWADTAEYARGAAGGDLTGDYPNPSIAADSVNSSMILNGTIQRADVAADFKAPFADSADYTDTADIAKGINPQVGCFVWFSGTPPQVVTTAATTIKFDKIKYDFGSNFDTTTHEFTAPVNGYYEIYVQARGHTFPDTVVFSIDVVKEGAGLTPPPQNLETTSFSGEYLSTSIYYLQYCSKGERLKAIARCSSGSGYLNQQMVYMIIGLKYRK